MSTSLVTHTSIHTATFDPIVICGRHPPAIIDHVLQLAYYAVMSFNASYWIPIYPDSNRSGIKDFKADMTLRSGGYALRLCSGKRRRRFR